MGRDRKWVLQDDIQEAMWRTIFARTTSSITPVATCPEVTEEVDPAEAQRVSARIADTGPNIAPEAITEAAAVEVRRLEGAVAALGEESPHGKPLLTALKAAKVKLNVPISVQIESTTLHLERARKRLTQAKAEVVRVTAQKDQCVADVEAAEWRLERRRLRCNKSRDELIRERDSLQVSVKATSRLQHLPLRGRTC